MPRSLIIINAFLLIGSYLLVSGDRPFGDYADAWYERAPRTEGASHASVSVAHRFRLQQPLAWIRDLDSPQPDKEPQQQSQVKQPEQSAKHSQPYVTKDPPAGLTLATNLSQLERRENLEALWRIIDANYADFELKSIDWAEVRGRYLKRLDTIRTDDDFYLMMFQLVNELKDTHSWLQNYRVPTLPDVYDVAIETFQGRPFVITGEKAGWELLSVNGLLPEQKREALRPYLHAFSSGRAFERAANRSLLAGNDGEAVKVSLQPPDGHSETVTWKRTAGHGHRPPDSKLPMFVTKQRYVNFGRHPSGLGYIQIETFNGREAIDQEFDRALEALRDTYPRRVQLYKERRPSHRPGAAGNHARTQRQMAIHSARRTAGQRPYWKCRRFIRYRIARRNAGHHPGQHHAR